MYTKSLACIDPVKADKAIQAGSDDHKCLKWSTD